MKKFLMGVLAALMIFGIGATGEACCGGGNYYCAQDCDDYNGGDYCGRYGCYR